jgi:putative transposase
MPADPVSLGDCACGPDCKNEGADVATELQRIDEQGIYTCRLGAVTTTYGVTRPLAALDLDGHQAADDAAHSFRLPRRQVYILIPRARQDLVTDLARGQSSDGKGKGRLSESVSLILVDRLTATKPRIG